MGDLKFPSQRHFMRYQYQLIVYTPCRTATAASNAADQHEPSATVACAAVAPVGPAIDATVPLRPAPVWRQASQQMATQRICARDAADASAASVAVRTHSTVRSASRAPHTAAMHCAHSTNRALCVS